MFGHNSKVDLELNREVEKLIKTGGKEKIMPIVQAGEPVLRQQTIAYDGQLSRKTLDKLIDTMRTTMLEAPGVGLAATQIGLGLALAIHWEITHLRHPERFYEETNCTLSCANCEERLCAHKKQLHALHKKLRQLKLMK